MYHEREVLVGFLRSDQRGGGVCPGGADERIFVSPWPQVCIIPDLSPDRDGELQTCLDEMVCEEHIIIRGKTRWRGGVGMF